MASQSLSHSNSRVAFYGRVSTKDKGQEVENQLRQLREFAAAQGWTVYREYVDHETGKNGEGTVYRLEHAPAKNPLGAAPVSRYAQAAD